MSTIQTLSPIALEDAIQFCDECGEETNHVSMITRFTATGETGYMLECETCTLAWEWA